MCNNKASGKRDYVSPRVKKVVFAQDDVLTSSANDWLLVEDKTEWNFWDGGIE